MSSLTFSQGKLNGPSRQSIIEALQIKMQQAALTAILSLISQFLAAELTAKLGRAKAEPRTISNQPRLIDWVCAGCGCNDANYFIRDGHYQRALANGWGYLKGLPVPMIECVKCQHDVVAHWAILEKYQHFWLDFDQQVLFGSGLCQSLRQLSQEWSATLGSQGGLKTINERINQVEAQIQKAQNGPLSAVPAVVQLDGIWLSLQTESEVIKLDRKGRKRHQRKGKRAVILVALGL